MADRATDELTSSILSLLSKKLDPQRSRTIQVQLSNVLQRPIADLEFASAVDALLAQGRLRRVRGGPGGQLVLDQTDPATAEQEPVAGVQEPGDWSLERNLMPAIERYLRLRYVPLESGLPPTAVTWVRDTSTGGPHGAGPWSRPDFTLAAVAAHRFVQPRSLELYGFELKPEARCDVRAVHEAFAHSRFVHYAYLAWHLPAQSLRRSVLGTVREYCTELGVGLIVFEQPDQVDTYSILVDPARKNPAPEAIDAFMMNRFSEEDCAAIERAVRG
jgi:hypothetical protein